MKKSHYLHFHHWNLSFDLWRVDWQFVKPIVSCVPPYIWPFDVLKWYSNPNLSQGEAAPGAIGLDCFLGSFFVDDFEFLHCCCRSD
jgi:hypothetical protein